MQSRFFPPIQKAILLIKATLGSSESVWILSASMGLHCPEEPPLRPPSHTLATDTFHLRLNSLVLPWGLCSVLPPLCLTRVDSLDSWPPACLLNTHLCHFQHSHHISADHWAAPRICECHQPCPATGKVIFCNPYLRQQCNNQALVPCSHCSFLLLE